MGRRALTISRALGAGGLMLTVAGCAGAPGANTPDSPAPLVGTTWLAQTINGQQASLAPASQVTFDTGSKITGNGGCNTFFGTIGYSGDQLAVGPLATTRKMCPPEVMNQEAQFIRGLETAQRYEMSQWLLTLYGPSGNAQMTLTRVTGGM